MKFSLIMGTLGRTHEVAAFLASLQRQDHRDFELLIVDQNPDDRLAPVIEPYRQHFRVLRYRSPPGLSRARNVGLRYVSGEVIAFPDDDCWYPDGLLSYVARRLKAQTALDGLTGRFVDAEGQSEGRWLSHTQALNRFNVWNGGISFSIFLRRGLVERIGGFDEALGVGAGTPWGAGEETDFLLRGLQLGAALEFDHDLVLRHPVKTADFGPQAIERQRLYEAGFGRVIRRSRFPAWYFPWVCSRTAAGTLLALCSGRLAQARFKWHSLRARVSGWRSGLRGACAAPAVQHSSTNV
jgi:glycosyltransferase involved in cell wall biosynthesis